MSIPNPTKYFQLISERRLSDAEKTLEDLRQNAQATDRGKGYMKALEGLFLGQKTNDDKYLYLSHLTITEDLAERLEKDFLSQARNELHGDYDRGFFQALSEYMAYLRRGRTEEAPPKPVQAVKKQSRKAGKRIKTKRKRKR